MYNLIINNNIMIADPKKFREAAEPLLKYLNENHNPHVTAIVTSTSIELLAGVVSEPEIFDYIKG